MSLHADRLLPMCLSRNYKTHFQWISLMHEQLTRLDNVLQTDLCSQNCSQNRFQTCIIM